jgi:hypothetical protein
VKEKGKAIADSSKTSPQRGRFTVLCPHSRHTLLNKPAVRKLHLDYIHASGVVEKIKIY